MENSPFEYVGNGDKTFQVKILIANMGNWTFKWLLPSFHEAYINLNIKINHYRLIPFKNVHRFRKCHLQ